MNVGETVLALGQLRPLGRWVFPMKDLVLS
jgi:hypothetical protein